MSKAEERRIRQPWRLCKQDQLLSPARTTAQPLWRPSISYNSLALSPFHLRRAASRSDRMLQAMRGKTAATKGHAALDLIWRLLLLNEIRFSLATVRRARRTQLP